MDRMHHSRTGTILSGRSWKWGACTGPRPLEPRRHSMRRFPHPIALTVVLSLAITAIASMVPHAAGAKSATYAPHIDPANFQATVDHPYFPLVPGTRFLFREAQGGKAVENELTVLPETKQVMG